MSYFEAYGFGASDLEKYCVGTDVIAGYGCWIIDAKGFNGITDIYWINMENGVCMKTTDKDGNVDFEVTMLDLNY